MEVRATDALGAVESSPARAQWTVVPPPPPLQVTFLRRTGPYTVTVQAPRGAVVRVTGTLLITGRTPMRLPDVRGRGRHGGTLKLILRLDRHSRRVLSRSRASASLRVKSIVTKSGERRVDTVTRSLPD